MSDRTAHDLERHLIAEEKSEAIMKELVYVGECYVDKDFQVVEPTDPKVDKRITVGPRYQLTIEEMLPLEGEPDK